MSINTAYTRTPPPRGPVTNEAARADTIMTMALAAAEGLAKRLDYAGTGNDALWAVINAGHGNVLASMILAHAWIYAADRREGGR